jgi:formylmethanofuran dehydrogenase subunit B
VSNFQPLQLSVRTMSKQPTGAQEFVHVPCPFCGLLCDDLRISVADRAATVLANGCARSRRLFSATSDADVAPLVNGKPETLEVAANKAAAILREARQPLLISAGTDVAGMRALLELAERTGGIFDHRTGDAMMRNLLVLQDSGLIGTTLTEVRNRADLLIVAGTDISTRFPRFFERIFGEFDSLFMTGEREICFLGAMPDDLPAPLKARATSAAVEPERLGEVFGALRSLLAGRTLIPKTVAGIATQELAALLARMQRARYGVLTWVAADLAFPHAELAIQSMCELVTALNASVRFAVLPLGGTDGDLTAAQVTTWQTGFPLRVSFAGGKPAYDPWQHSARRLLEHSEADAVVFVSALDASHAPPESDAPAIVLSRPGTLTGNGSVFIPVATPGLHHAGHLYRTDNVVALRVRKLAESALPSAAQALQTILHAMEKRL